MLDKPADLPDTRPMAASKPFGVLIDRKSVLLPTLFSVVFVVSLFLVAAAGQTRLAESNGQLREAEYRARRLSDFLRYMVDAETASRGYVITGDPEYLAPLDSSPAASAMALDDLAKAYADIPAARKDIETLKILSDTCLGLFDQVVERRSRGFEPAALLIRANVGKRTMDQLREVVRTISEEERGRFDTAQARASTDLVQGRWLFGLGALLNVLLVVLAGVLISLDLRRRVSLAGTLVDQRELLERQVSARTEELAALSTHLQTVAEEERSALARELHDELGSLLVAARMDLSWLQRKLPTEDPAVRLRWQRIQDGLDAGVNLKRRVVEQLRPTLLDNMGLYAALRWQFQESCGRAGLKCTEHYPDPEVRLTDAAAIAVFRMAQEAFTNILKHARARSVDLAVSVDAVTREFIIRVADDGVGIAADHGRSASGSHGLASMRHRVGALGGTWSMERGSPSGTVLTARLPLQRVLESEMTQGSLPE
jgi:signal transduction histidine kinase